jgi:hypothetical protein
MAGTRVRRQRPYALALLLAAALLSWAGLAAAGNPNEREVKPQPNVQDTDNIFDKDGNYNPDSKIWALEFRFKDPRLITVDVPGRGRKVCWYLWYQVINRTKDPHLLIPDFELVTIDKNTIHHDQILPKVQEAIQKVEDPADYLKIKNSVTISAEPIPPSKADANPRAVTGVAIWDDVNPDTTSFSIFVSGLSNGWALTDPIPPDTEPVVRRKTLQLNFKRPGDRFYQDSREIQFVPPAVWVYRGAKLKVPALPNAGKEAPKADAPKPDAPKPDAPKPDK